MQSTIETSPAPQPGRILWIDTARCIGMFAIYLGHMGNAAGRAYPFVYMFHVPLFFFLAGCTEALQVAVPFFSGIIRAAKKILVP